MDIRKFLNSLKDEPEYANQISSERYFPSRNAEFKSPQAPLPGSLSEYLDNNGIKKLFSHQAEAIDKIRAGEDVVLVSGTASGKTLCYNLPIAEHLQAHPQDKALYIFPTKALAQDQLRVMQSLAESTLPGDISVNTYDGDTPQHKRKKIRNSTSLFISNPDMLHTAILPNHTKWAPVLSRLRYVVVDEIHTYRGVFGSHVAIVLRRLNRLISYYGGKVQYVCASATIGNPAELAGGLTGREFCVIDYDGSPRGGKYFVFWNPPLADRDRDDRKKKKDKIGKPSSSFRTSANIQAQHLLTRLMRAGVQTVAFTRTRVTAELLYKYVHDYFSASGNPLADAISPYRGGYLAENRRQIESDLLSGKLKAVASTNALELGIDIGGLDACILVGYPGSVASTRQRAGRVGRTLQESIVIFIGTNDPIDQFLMHRPEFLFQQAPEQAVINPHNPYILSAHLGCAAFELPLSNDDEQYFGPIMHNLISILEETSYLKRIKDRWYWSQPGYPSFATGLRTATGDTCTIVEAKGEQEVIGTLDMQSAYHMVHSGAIYLHEGESYYVRHLDIRRKVAAVEKSTQDYFTMPQTSARLKLIKRQNEQSIRSSSLGFGDVEVSTSVFSFSKIRFYTLERLGHEKLDLPEQLLDTSAFWTEILLDSDYLAGEQVLLAEGLVGIKNLFLVILPIIAMCDRNDIGGVVDSRVFGHPAVFIYDKYPGGMGFAEHGYTGFDRLLSMAFELVNGCECESGCPACVGGIDPSQALFRDMDEQGIWIPPDKKSALKILDLLRETSASAG